MLAGEEPRIWTPGERRIEREHGGDWRRWRDADPEELRCMGAFGSAPGGYQPAAMGATRLQILLATACLKLFPASLVNSSGSVGSWTNTGTGAGLNVAPGTAPAYSATGGKNGAAAAVFTSASSQYLVTAASTFTWTQANTVMVRAKLVSATVAQTLCDGTTGSTLRVFQTTSSHPSILSPTQLTSTDSTSAGTWLYFVGQFNGTSSKVGLSALTTTGNAGTNSAAGFTVGTLGGHTAQFVNGSIDLIAGWTSPVGLLSGTDISLLTAYFDTL